MSFLPRMESRESIKQQVDVELSPFSLLREYQFKSQASQKFCIIVVVQLFDLVVIEA